VIRYAARAVPWRLVATNCALVTAMMAMVATWPRVMWPLEGTAVGLLAGTAAWSMDERAAAIVDSLPRPLQWRTAARSLALVPLAGTWSACVLLAARRLPPHTVLFLIQGLAGLLFAVGFVTVERADGRAEPGARFAAIAIPASALFALARPIPQVLPLFPIWPSERWDLSLVLWSTLAVTSAFVLLGGVRAPLVRHRAPSSVQRARRCP
jgi:hypothetical protein